MIRTIKGPIRTVYAGMYYHKNIEEPIHGYLVRTVVFSPDGKYIASGGRSKYIKIWDVKSGHLVKKIEGHKEGINSLAFSPKDRYLLASGGKDHTVKVWKFSEKDFSTVDKNSTTTKTMKVSKETSKPISTKSVSTSSPETQYLKQLHEKIKKGGAGYLMGSGFDKDTDKGIEIIRKNMQGIMKQ